MLTTLEYPRDLIRCPWVSLPMIALCPSPELRHPERSTGKTETIAARPRPTLKAV
jgi:hypothetical protein